MRKSSVLIRGHYIRGLCIHINMYDWEGEGRRGKGEEEEGGEEREGKRGRRSYRVSSQSQAFPYLTLGSSDLSLDLQDSLFPLRVPWCLSS